MEITFLLVDRSATNGIAATDDSKTLEAPRINNFIVADLSELADFTMLAALSTRRRIETLQDQQDIRKERVWNLPRNHE